MRAWMLRGGAILLVGTLLAVLSGCGHDPNHGINKEQAKAAANRVHPQPPPGTKMKPGFGG
jgi:hypothetical protein